MGAGIRLFNNVYNQNNSTAINSDLFENRPTAGYFGRLFFSLDTVSGDSVYWDSGNEWLAVASKGSGGGLLGANNGCSINNTDVFLGGELLQNTTITTYEYTFNVVDNLGGGITIDNSNSLYYFGKGNALDGGLSLQIDGGVDDRIYTSYGGNNNGINLQYTAGLFDIGSFYDVTESDKFAFTRYDVNNVVIQTICQQDGDGETDYHNIYHTRYNYYIRAYNDIGGSGFNVVDYKCFDTNINANTKIVSGYFDDTYTNTQLDTQINLTHRNNTVDGKFESAYNFDNMPVFSNQNQAVAGGLLKGDLWREANGVLHIVI